MPTFFNVDCNVDCNVEWVFALDVKDDGTTDLMQHGMLHAARAPLARRMHTCVRGARATPTQNHHVVCDKAATPTRNTSRSQAGQ